MFTVVPTEEKAKEVKYLGPASGIGETIHLPNGYLVPDHGWVRELKMREMTGIEEDLLSDRQLQRDGVVMRRVLENVVKSIGPVSERGQVQKLIGDTNLSDAAYLTVRLRQLSLGDEVRFSGRCTNENCQEETYYKLNLAEQPVTFRKDDNPPKETYEVLFEGHTIIVRAFKLSDQPKLTQGRKEFPDKLLTYRLGLRVISIDGEALRSWKDVQGLSTRARDAIRGALDKQEFGLDVMVENDCPICGRRFKVPLPVQDEGFFFPSGIQDS